MREASLGVEATPLKAQYLPACDDMLSQVTKSTPKIVIEEPLYEEYDDVELL